MPQILAPQVGSSAFWVAEDDARIRKNEIIKRIGGPPRPKFLKMHGRLKNQNVKIMSNGGILYVKWWEDSKSGLEFKSDNISPSFWPKNSNLGIFSKIPIKSLDLTLFSAKRWSNFIRFEFCGQIWNPLIILRMIGPHLTWFSHLDFSTSHAFSNFGRGGCRGGATDFRQWGQARPLSYPEFSF